MRGGIRLCPSPPPRGGRASARRIDTDILREGAWPLDQHPLTFICGPTPLVETAASGLLALGHVPAHIKTERFVPTVERGWKTTCMAVPLLPRHRKHSPMKYPWHRAPDRPR